MASSTSVKLQQCTSLEELFNLQLINPNKIEKEKDKVANETQQTTNNAPKTLNRNISKELQNKSKTVCEAKNKNNK